MLSLVSVFPQDKRFKTLFTPSLVSVFEINFQSHYFFHPFPFITPLYNQLPESKHIRKCSFQYNFLALVTCSFQYNFLAFVKILFVCVNWLFFFFVVLQLVSMKVTKRHQFAVWKCCFTASDTLKNRNFSISRGTTSGVIQKVCTLKNR